MRQRWFSRRAFALHLAVVVIAPACGFAGWWQATRALAGNDLSWAYSVEWPIFALLAIAGWWHLVHEDPQEYEARKIRAAEESITLALAALPPRAGAAAADAGLAGSCLPSAVAGAAAAAGAGAAAAAGAGAGAAAGAGAGAAAGAGAGDAATAATASAGVRPVEAPIARLATGLAAALGAEVLFGVMAILAVPFNRPSLSLPSRGEIVYIVHGVFGVLLWAGAFSLLLRTRTAGRGARLTAWFGISGITLAGAGGLLTEAPSLARFLGMALMCIGALVAGFGYAVPALLKRSRAPMPPPQAGIGPVAKANGLHTRAHA